MSSNEINDSSQGSSRGRGHWSSRAGFVLAAAGSAIGLGNIWKFPYITGEFGGGAFVIVYLGCVLLVGLPLMVAELMIGRRAQKNPVGAFQALHKPGSLWQTAGWLGVASGFLILSFYSVIAGWAIAYVFKSLAGFSGTAEQIQGQFVALVTNPAQSIFWHTLFMGLTIGIVAGGIKNGIERWSKILMPSLFVLLTGLMFYGLFGTSGGWQAISFLFNPDFSKLTATGFLSALGHAFFTLSLGMGAMITYGSYMERGANIVKDAITISVLDTVIALMAGIAIFSLVFHYGMEPGQSVGLIFKTLPVLFRETGRWISVPFFVLLTFAALTSAISLLEVVVSYFVDQLGWKRVKATIMMGTVTYLIGILSAVVSWQVSFRGQQQGFLDIFDYLTTNYMLPVGGVLTCLFVAWVMKEKEVQEEFGSTGFAYKGLRILLGYITPLAVLMVLLHGLGLLPFVSYE